MMGTAGFISSTVPSPKNAHMSLEALCSGRSENLEVRISMRVRIYVWFRVFLRFRVYRVCFEPMEGKRPPLLFQDHEVNKIENITLPFITGLGRDMQAGKALKQQSYTASLGCGLQDNILRVSAFASKTQGRGFESRNP